MKKLREKLAYWTERQPEWKLLNRRQRGRPIAVDQREARESSLLELRIAPLGEMVWVPTEKVRYRFTAAAPTPEQQPFVRYFQDGHASLSRYYSLHRPTNQMEAAFVQQTDNLTFQPVSYPFNRAPWGFEGTYQGMGGLDSSHGCSWHGPSSEAKVKLEAKRLDVIRSSISRYGMLRFPGPDFLNYKLLIDDVSGEEPDFRVLVVGGQHRVAFLAYLGWPLLPMVPAIGTVPETSDREVRLSDLKEWPGVLDGTFSKPAAEAYFFAFFRDPKASLLKGW